MSEQIALRSEVEVERKFIPTALLQAQVASMVTMSGFVGSKEEVGASTRLSFFRLPDKDIKDKYIDYHDVYMRKRATCVIQTKNFPLVNDAPDSAPAEWQAKMRLGCDLTSSQMLEACGGANMRRVAKLFTPGVEVEQYKYTAELLTRRGTYIVQKPFGWDSEANQAGEIRVVLDEVVEMEGGEPVHQGEDAFRHVVGEVELTAEVVGGENEDEHEVLRRREVMGMQGRLDEFGRRNEAVSPAEGVKGKLEAFYGWKEARGGHEAIV